MQRMIFLRTFLILMIVSQNEAGFCYRCSDIMSVEHCIKFVSPGTCQWSSGTCSNSDQNSKSIALPVDPALNSMLCQNKINCAGNDKGDVTKTCVLNNVTLCVPIDNTQNCTYYPQEFECSDTIKYGCYWSKTSKTCSSKSCASFKKKPQCTVARTSHLQATACKWSQKKCISGSASDLEKTTCTQSDSIFYTWNGTQCIDCAGSSITSQILQSVSSLAIFITMMMLQH